MGMVLPRHGVRRDDWPWKKVRCALKITDRLSSFLDWWRRGNTHKVRVRRFEPPGFSYDVIAESCQDETGRNDIVLTPLDEKKIDFFGTISRDLSFQP